VLLAFVMTYIKMEVGIDTAFPPRAPPPPPSAGRCPNEAAPSRDEATPFRWLHFAGSVFLGSIWEIRWRGILVHIPHRYPGICTVSLYLHYVSATDLPLLVSTPFKGPCYRPFYHLASVRRDTSTLRLWTMLCHPGVDSYRLCTCISFFELIGHLLSTQPGGRGNEERGRGRVRR
jgi:hypothetical protein